MTLCNIGQAIVINKNTQFALLALKLAIAKLPTLASGENTRLFEPNLVKSFMQASKLFLTNTRLNMQILNRHSNTAN